MGKNNLSRRDFIKMTVIGLGASLLAACQGLIQRATQAPAPKIIVAPSDTPKPSDTPEPTSTDTPTATEIPCFKLLTPEDGAQLPALGKVTFSWEAMLGATRYQLQITLPTKQVMPFDVEDTSYTRYLESFPMGGTFIWQVTAFDTNSSVICVSGPFTFIKAESGKPGGEDNPPGPVVGTTVGSAIGTIG